jgi:MoaA/NifB/PqqE/SkfB family radical SAM enzyme
MKAKISRTAKPKRKILFFDVHICGHCNLNCKGCTNFCSIAEKRFVDLDILERDFKRLSELTDRKSELNLMGGEPLLHPDIIKIYDITRKYFDCKAQLVTNGILLANQPDEFWQSCRKNAIKIVISVYPIKIDEEKIIEQA